MSDSSNGDKFHKINNYDATKDPRTGRPPDPLEIQRIAHERLENQAKEEASSSNIEGQRPGRMTGPEPNPGEVEAIDALVQEGVTREHAEELVRARGADGDRESALSEHDERGIPPFEPPERA